LTTSVAQAVSWDPSVSLWRDTGFIKVYEAEVAGKPPHRG